MFFELDRNALEITSITREHNKDPDVIRQLEALIFCGGSLSYSTSIIGNMASNE